MFGKIMSISDELMWRYFELLSFQKMDIIKASKERCEAGLENPRNIKFGLAKEIVSRFHGGKAAGERALENFIARFQQGRMPDEIPEISLKCPDGGLPHRQSIEECGLNRKHL